MKVAIAQTCSDTATLESHYPMFSLQNDREYMLTLPAHIVAMAQNVPPIERGRERGGSRC